MTEFTFCFLNQGKIILIVCYCLSHQGPEIYFSGTLKELHKISASLKGTFFFLKSQYFRFQMRKVRVAERRVYIFCGFPTPFLSLWLSDQSTHKNHWGCLFKIQTHELFPLRVSLCRSMVSPRNLHFHKHCGGLWYRSPTL